ncbi:hypothetical protein TNCV_3547801 [Trichonephila clavipes]|nr:hypothetical protein TNCV_3547801 [Trichonephila clavipes]
MGIIGIRNVKNRQGNRKRYITRNAKRWNIRIVHIRFRESNTNIRYQIKDENFQSRNLNQQFHYVYGTGRNFQTTRSALNMSDDALSVLRACQFLDVKGIRRHDTKDDEPSEDELPRTASKTITNE